MTVVLDPRVDVEAGSLTLGSIVSQDWPRIEVVALAGPRDRHASAPFTWREHGIERWSTIPDGRDSLALGDAIDAAAGRHLVFLGPGETFPRVDTLSSGLRRSPAEADLIVGNHLSRDERGFEEICIAADPSQAYLRLRRGELSWKWLEAIPPRPAMIWRTDFLRRIRFRSSQPRLMHEDALLRALQQGALVNHSLVCLVSCPGRWSSVRERLRTLEAWRDVAGEHTDRSEILERAIEQMRSEARWRELHRLPALDLVLSAGRARGAFRELKRRLRTRRALADTRAPRSPSRSTLR